MRDRRKSDSESEGYGERQRREAVGLRYIAWVWGGGLEQSIMQLIYM